MHADKSRIKDILDGQTGEEVAANIRSNFDYVIDQINNIDTKIIKQVNEVKI